MRKISVLWACAYVAVGVASFSIIAAVERDKIQAVKVRQVPTCIPTPVEITQEAYRAKSR